MIWRDPLYFALLAAVLVLGGALVALLRRRAALLRLFAEAALIARLTPDVDGRYLARRTIVRLAALALIVVALAGPKYGFHWQEVRREGIDLIVALDTSRSMLATDVKPNRLERAKFAIMDLLPLLQGDRIGLVPFAGTAFLECPLTLDYAAFERSLRAVDVGIIPRGGTALARAIDTSLDAFEARQGKYEALILITDGEDHEGDLKEAAARAAERGVKIFTVGIGTSEGELLPLGQSGFVKDRSGQVVKSRLAEDPLKEIAEASGGAYVRGLGPSLGLDEVFRDHIATMERREVASALERRYEERFQIPLGLAFLLLLIEQLMPRRRTVPPLALAAARGTRRAAALLLCLLPLLVGFLDPPGDLGAEGNALYREGQFDAAAGKYGEALVDMPASPLLQFNLAAAQYKQGKLDEAIVSLTKVAATGDPEWVPRATFNLGNAQYRVGEAAEESDPQAAIKAYEEALASYKRSMVADQSDPDPKFNHEFVSRKLAELKKRLEEEQEKQEQEEQEKQEQQEQPPQDEQQKDEEQSEEQQQEQPPQEEQQGGEEQQDQQQEQAQQPPPPEEQPPEGEQEPQPQQQPEVAQEPAEPQGGAAAAAEEGDPSDPDQQAAQAVLDTARGEELGPEDLKRPAVAGVGEPSQDW